MDGYEVNKGKEGHSDTSIPEPSPMWVRIWGGTSTADDVFAEKK